MIKTKKEGILAINCLVDNSGGSNMLSIAFKKLTGMSVLIDNIPHTIEVSFVEVPLGKKRLEEFMLINYDILVSHWLLENSSSEIDWLCQKNDCLFFNFFDDFVNENAYLWHPLYKTQKMNGQVVDGARISAYIKQRTIMQAAIANLLICTTQPIIDQLAPFSDAIHLSPNYLPYNEGQYQVVNNESNSEKGRILVIGSASHFNDFQEIKNIIRKISDDSGIHNTMKWVIAGAIQGDKEWMKFINLFTTNPKMDVEVIEAAPVDDYMKLYSFGDIVFQPLTDNFFNRAKSSLKIAEASCYNLPVVGSKLYAEKELTGFCKCDKPKDYYTWVKYFAKNRNWKEMGEKLSEINRNESKFTEKIERLRMATEIILNREEYKPKDLKIWGLTYKDDQFTEYERYDNSKNSFPQRFEYSAFLDIIDNKLGSEKYLAALSWRFPQKTNLSKKLIYRLFEENEPRDADFINLTPKYFRSGQEYMAFSEQHHPGLTHILQLCLKNLGKEYIIPKNVVFSNFFIMKTELWKEYINEWIKPTLDYMENQIWNLVNVDTNYEGGISKEELQKVNGLTFFNMETFVLERLMGIFVDSKQLKVITI